MQRLISWVLVLLLYAMPGQAMEYAEPEEEAFVFSFRNGVTWESTWDEVIQAENASDYYEPNANCINFPKVLVSNYSSALRYVFEDEQLVSIYYCLVYDWDQDDYSYLTEALTYKYETPSPASPERLLTLMNCIDESDDYEINELTNWAMEDGTYIAIFKMDGQPYIMYFNEEKLLRLSGVYNTSGL